MSLQRNRIASILATVLALNLILFALITRAAPGDLDTSFDSDGLVTTPIGSGHDYGYGVVLQSDGKIVVAGHGHNGSNFDYVVAR